MRKNELTITAEQQLFIIKLPSRLRGTYVTWLLGFNGYFTMSRETYYRHAQELLKYGVDIRKDLSPNNNLVIDS